MHFPDPGELEHKARMCEVQAARLRSTSVALHALKNSIFSCWTGTAAQSLHTAVGAQLSAVEAAEADLRRAAHMLRLGAQDVSAAIQREEEERAKHAASRRREEQG